MIYYQFKLTKYVKIRAPNLLKKLLMPKIIYKEKVK